MLVNVPGHGPYKLGKLLGDGDSNTKLRKSDAAGKEYLTVGLSLSPANESGYQTCSSSSAGCRKACLFTSGMAKVFKSINLARRAKTIAFFEQRTTFLERLVSELQDACRKADKQGKVLAVRLNVVSDIQWEKIAPELFTIFPNVQFYDYTKHTKRMLAWCNGGLPSNYHLTFSRSEGNEKDCLRVLFRGGNVTVVFDKKNLPAVWNDYDVVNGDGTDLRFLDGTGVVVGLYAKGQAKKDESGFVVRTSLPMIA